MIEKKFARKWLSALLIAGCIVGVVAYPQPGMAAVNVVVQVAPPPPRVEHVPPPRYGYIWVPGHWDWRGHRHVWVRGKWLKERPGYRYQPYRWVERNGDWYLERERWDRYPTNPNRP